MVLSISQQRALALAPTIAACLSLVCSTAIATIILRDKKKRKKVYHRLLLGMSLSDICISVWWALSTRPIPVETGILWAKGNTMTCTAQGFFVQLGIANPLYNVSLSVFYLLTVKVRWGEDKVRKVEPLFHICPLLWGSWTAIAGIFLKIFNSANLWCWIADYPGRNENTDIYRLAFFYFPLWFAIVVVTINLIRLFRYVQRITVASEKHTCPSTYDPEEEGDIGIEYHQNLHDQGFGRNQDSSPRTGGATNGEKPADGGEQALRTQSNSSGQEETSAHPSGHAQRRRKLAWQFLRYTLAFYATWTPVTVLRFLQAIDGNGEAPFALLLLAAICTPLQGLPNFVVYLYPQFLEKVVADWHIWSFCRRHAFCRSPPCCYCLLSTCCERVGDTPKSSPSGASTSPSQQFHNALMIGMEKRGMLHNEEKQFKSTTIAEERRSERRIIALEDGGSSSAAQTLFGNSRNKMPTMSEQEDANATTVSSVAFQLPTTPSIIDRQS